MVEKLDKIWFDGEFVDWDKAQVHVLTHALHYGTSVFEGIRCYEKDGKANIFKLREHIERLFNSAKALNIEIDYSVEEMVKATEDLIKVNNIKACYIRPIIFLGEGPMGIDTRNSPAKAAIIAWPWGAYLGEDGIEKGIKITVCPYKRSINELSKAKIGGAYYVSVLAKRFALDNGFDEALMLDTEDNVAEGSGENIFMVKDGVLITPKLGAVLPGITRASVMDIAKEFDIEVVEENISLERLLDADEIFFTGTAAEITPIVQIDENTVADGIPGPITKKIKDEFFNRL